MYELTISRNGDQPMTKPYPTLLDAVHAVDDTASANGLAVRMSTDHLSGFLVDRNEAKYAWSISAAVVATKSAAHQAQPRQVEGLKGGEGIG